MKHPDIVIGLDLGTGGARALACDKSGRIVCTAEETLHPDPAPSMPGYSEQQAPNWWHVTTSAFRQLMSALGCGDRVRAIAVSSTSGTILPIDNRGNALAPAMMHNDTRAGEQAEEVGAAAGHPISATFALPKVLWLKRHKPEVFRKTARFVHEADFIVGKLTGEYGVSDTFNVLKMGYDLIQNRWPEFIERQLGIPREMLPAVVRPGTIIGKVTAHAANETGLPKGAPVVAGATDSNAAFFASGAAHEGEWNSTLGTSLAVKGVSERFIADPLGRVYCHRHPEGLWLPGGASNTGADCMRALFESDYEVLNRRVAGRFPSNLLVYPLIRKGERFPFISDDAAGFVVGDATDRLELFAGYMEGVAYVERWAYDLLENLGAPVCGTVYATGGGSRSNVWLRVRASVLNKVFARAASAESAMGAAIIAASATMYSAVSEASKNMVRVELRVAPEASLAEKYETLYRRFRDEMTRRGYE